MPEEKQETDNAVGLIGFTERTQTEVHLPSDNQGSKFSLRKWKKNRLREGKKKSIDLKISKAHHKILQEAVPIID